MVVNSDAMNGQKCVNMLRNNRESTGFKNYSVRRLSGCFVTEQAGRILWHIKCYVVYKQSYIYERKERSEQGRPLAKSHLR